MDPALVLTSNVYDLGVTPVVTEVFVCMHRLANLNTRIEPSNDVCIYRDGLSIMNVNYGVKNPFSVHIVYT